MLYNKRYERIGERHFRMGIREILQNIPFEQLTNFDYEISLLINVELLDKVYLDYYERIGLLHGKKIGASINSEIRQKTFKRDAFNEGYRESIRQWLLNNAGTRIMTVRENLIQYLVKFIADKGAEGNDIRTIARMLQKHILSRGFYRWQIMRIVRTETTAAANQGAIRAGNSSGIIWEKEWISSNDSRTRRTPPNEYDHLEMDGIRVGKDEPFNVQGALLQFPGDPKGPPGAVINCRCAVSVVAKRDENGRIIFQ